MLLRLVFSSSSSLFLIAYEGVYVALDLHLLRLILNTIGHFKGVKYCKYVCDSRYV